MNSRGAPYSAALHIALLLLLVFGLPGFMHRAPEPEPEAISVEILPLAPVSNIAPHEKPPEKPPEKPEEKKPVEPAETKPKPTPPTKTESAEKPVEIPEKVKPQDVVKPVPKKPEEKKKKPPKPDDLDAILKSVEKQARAEESKKPSEKAPTPDTKPEAKSTHYDPAMPLSMSEMDIIRQQVQRNWTPPVGAKDANTLIVELHIEMLQDGTVTLVELASDQSRYNSDPYFRAAADAAMRAVHRASPLKNLPADKYSDWSDMIFTFNPKDMLQ